MADDITKKLLNFYRVGFKKPKGKNADQKNIQVFPTAPKPTEKRPNHFAPVNFPSELDKYYKYWLTQCHDSSGTLSDRFDRYKDLKFMYDNNTIISRASHLYGDETTQSDSQSRIIVAEAKNKKLQKDIYDWLKLWGYTPQRLNELAWGLALYGDGFDINVIDSIKGITEVIPKDVRDIREKLEFNPTEVHKQMIDNSSFRNYTGKTKSINNLIQNLSNPKDYTEFFRTYIFGYHMTGDIYLPPWGVTHYRMFTNQTEFYPYGRSMFVNCISPFRQLKAFENLQAMARAAQFPKETYEVETDENMTQADVWNAVNEAREEYLNLNQAVANKEEFSLGSQTWFPKGLVTMDLQENKMKPQDMGDIEYFQQNLATGTGAPMSYLSPDDGNFGTTGISLVQQYKPFGRSVFKIQSAILNEINLKLQIHNTIIGKYSPEEFEYNLYMNFPSVEETRDRMSSKSDSIRLANDILTNLGQTLGLDRGEALPVSIVSDVFSKYSFLDDEEVTKWLKTFEKEKEVNPVVEKKIKNRLSEEIINEVYFKSFRDLGLKEGVINNNHFINSNNILSEQNFMLDMVKQEYCNTKLREEK